MIGALFLLIGMVCLTWGFWPQPERTLLDFLLVPEDMVLEGSAQPMNAPLEARRVILLGPAFLRTGENFTLRLRLEPIRKENPGRLKDINRTHNLVGEFRLELSDVSSEFEGELLSPMQPGLPVQVEWNLRAGATDRIEGLLWMHLIFVPLNADNAGAGSQRFLLSVPHISLPVTGLFGLGITSVQFIGLVSSGIAVFILLERKLAAWAFRRRPPDKSPY